MLSDKYLPLLVLLTFWTLWISVVLITNVFDGLKRYGLLSENWPFASGNYALIEKATSKFNPPAWLNRLFFAGAVVWQAIITILFWTALLNTFKQGRIASSEISWAFAASFGLFAAFVLADEICGNYQGERDHLLILAAQVVSYLTLTLLK